MAKTTFTDGDPSLGILGTIITAAMMNALNTHRHTGLDVDGAGAIDYAVSTGSANAYLLALSPVLSAYITGMPLVFKANFTNTSAATLNINGLGAVDLTKNVTDPLDANDIIANKMYIGIYDGANIQIINPSSTNRTGIMGSFRNLQAAANGTSSDVAITVDEIQLEDTINNYVTLRNVSVTIDTAASGANGLDTGALAGSTWYSMWLIYNVATQTVAGLISASATSPMLPGGYTYKTRIGWIRTDGTANKYVLSFKQCGRRVQYVNATGTNLAVLPTIISGVQGNISTPTWVAGAIGGVVPPTANTIKLLWSGDQGTDGCIIAPNSSYGGQGIAHSGNRPWVDINGDQDTYGGLYSFPFNMILESTNIYYASDGASNKVQCIGWEDNI